MNWPRNFKVCIKENLRIVFDFHLEFNEICVCRNEVKTTILCKYVSELINLALSVCWRSNNNILICITRSP